MVEARPGPPKAEQHGLADDIANAITGHRRKTVADSYGEYPIEALFRELVKIPAIKAKVANLGTTETSTGGSASS
jgi:hypothetical protein